MLYAGPLLYATALLAVVTILGHAVSLSTEPNGGGDQSRTDARQPVVWGVEKSVVEQEHPREEPEPTEDVPEDTESVDGESSQFTLQSAVGLAALSTGYVASLYLVPFVLSTAAFLAATVVLFGERDVLRIAGYSVGFTLVLWLVFINWLLVPLP